MRELPSARPLLLLLLLLLALHSSAPLAQAFKGIPGSQVHTDNGAKLLRGTLACFTKNGRWLRNPAPRELPWIRESYGRPSLCDAERGLAGGMEGAEADRAAAKGEGWTVRPELLWEWGMERCPWEKFNYEKFCRAMGSAMGKNGSILIVGDDFSYGLERRFLYNMLAAGPRNPFVVNLFPDGCTLWDGGVEKQMCTGYRYCHDVLQGDTVAVRFVSNHNLSQSRDVGTTAVPWLSAVNYFSPTIVVLNHGAPDTPMATFRENVRAAVHWVRKHRPKTLIVYRSTPSSAGACPPLAAAAGKEPLPPPLVASEKEYKEQNEIAKAIVEAFGGLYLDINPPLTARPKELLASGGCVDICQPGVLDSCVQLLYNALLEALPRTEAKTATTTTTAMVTAVSTNTTATTATAYPKEIGSAEQEEGGGDSYRISIEKYVRKPPPGAPVLTRVVPGSKISDERQLADVQARLSCFTHDGDWVYNATARPMAWEIAPLQAVSLCDRRHVAAGGITGAEADRVAARGGKWNVREAIKWEWRTATCPLEDFSLTSFCRVLGPGRSLLMLGDSITESYARHVFGHIFKETNFEKSPPVDLFPDHLQEWDVGLKRNLCFGYAVCHGVLGKPAEIRFCFNRWVSLTGVPLDGFAPWVTKLHEWRPSVVLLNRGAHFRADDVFGPAVRDTLRYIRAALPEALVLWRSTPPGHSNCTDYHGPIKERQDPSLLFKGYHWADFARQNGIARKHVEEIGGIYMDVDHAAALRPDGHVGVLASGDLDCLHYCQPGPLDSWVTLLQNFLKELL